jgi:DNA polymerase III subunit beta
MDLFIQQEELVKALGSVQGIVERRSTNLVTGQALLEASDSSLKITATDNELTLVGQFPANVADPGQISVNAAHFFQVAKALPTAPVRLLEEENHRLVVDAAPAHFKVLGTSTENFPALPAFDAQKTVKVKAGPFARIIDQTIFAIPTEDNRYGLNGGHVEALTSPEGESRVRLVTTDGSRLCYAETPYEGEFGMGKRMLVPRKALQEVRKLLDSPDDVATIGFGDRTITVTVGGYVLHSRLVDGEFPPYRRVLPASFQRQARVERLPLYEALRRVSIEAQDKAGKVLIQFGRDEMVISARSVEHGEARHPVPVDFQGNDITMGFNVRFFLDVLGCMDDSELTIQLEEALSPCIVRPSSRDDALFVIMPIRLD